MNIIGVVPMAGRATRLDQLPCSKEIIPVKLRRDAHNTGERPRVVCEYLLEKMHEAGVTRAYVILREGKWDIPAYLGDGSMAGLHLAYLMMGLPHGTPYSVDQAYPFLQHAMVTFGFPDMILGSAREGGHGGNLQKRQGQADSHKTAAHGFANHMGRGRLGTGFYPLYARVPCVASENSRERTGTFYG
jgi:dTDP-glucose pyrophosphorylase